MGPGLQFGQMQQNPDWNLTGVGAGGAGPNWVTEGTPMYQQSPLRSTDSYQRWGAYGMPGTGEPGSGLIRGVQGESLNPLYGGGDLGNLATQPGLAGAIVSGALRPEHLYPFVPDWNAHRELLISTLGVIGAAVFLNDPSVYFDGIREQYAPANMELSTLDRFAALYGAAPAAEEAA